MNLWTQCWHGGVQEVDKVRHHQPGNYIATNKAQLHISRTNFHKSKNKGWLIIFFKKSEEKIKGEDPERTHLNVGAFNGKDHEEERVWRETTSGGGN